jgi:hypothetical protein
MNDNYYQMYSYSWSTKLLFYILSLGLAALNLFLGVQLIFQIILWFSQDSGNISRIVGLIIALLIFCFCFAFVSNAYPNIRVYDRGLKIQAFLFWWIFVPWTEIENVWEVGVVKKTYAVAVRRLTPFHRIIGLGYGSLKPVFSIGWIMDRHEELIAIIKHNTQAR